MAPSPNWRRAIPGTTWKNRPSAPPAILSKKGSVMIARTSCARSNSRLIAWIPELTNSAPIAEKRSPWNDSVPNHRHPCAWIASKRRIPAHWPELRAGIGSRQSAPICRARQFRNSAKASMATANGSGPSQASGGAPTTPANAKPIIAMPSPGLNRSPMNARAAPASNSSAKRWKRCRPKRSSNGGGFTSTSRFAPSCRNAPPPPSSGARCEPTRVAGTIRRLKAGEARAETGRASSPPSDSVVYPPVCPRRPRR